MYRCLLAMLCALVALAGAAGAQEDPRLGPLIDRWQEMMNAPGPVFIRQYIEVAVNGQSQGEITQEAWLRDLQHFRVERTDGTVVLRTPESYQLFEGPSKVLLVVPQTTLDALGDHAETALQTLGLNEPRAVFDLLTEGREHLTITGEDRYGDEDCWVVACGEGLLPRWRAVLAGIPEELDLTVADIALGKETGAPRAMYFELTGPADIIISITIPDVQEELEIADEMFVFEPPEDALVITFTPDQKAEEVMAQVQQAVMDRRPKAPE